MKILAIGANGIIGRAVVNHLQEKHEVIPVGHSRGVHTVDIEDIASVETLFSQIGEVDAIICMAGNGEMGSMEDMPDSGYQTVLQNKVMGQINVVRAGLKYLTTGGSITLTSGQASNHPMPGTAAISTGVSAVNGFVAAAAVEMKEGRRINAVSPAMVKETMDAWGIDSSAGIPAREVAEFYQKSAEGEDNGRVFDAVRTPYNSQ